MSYQKEKRLVLDYFDAMEKAQPQDIKSVMGKFIGDSYNWKGVYPFRERNGIDAVADKFWIPLKSSLTNMQRRMDIFIAGNNEIDDDVWTMSMGHFMGLFDNDWLGIRHTGKINSLRYAEFNCVKNGKIVKTGLFIDIIGFMMLAGVNPLPPQTGSFFVYPGPRTHDGILLEDAPAEEGVKTLELVNKMVDDLSVLNTSGNDNCPPEILEKSWSKDMIWYGPGGIGASYTIPRYQKQHQYPFRKGLKDKNFNGHLCRFAEGKFACFFGWPNLTNVSAGGFLGMIDGSVKAGMQVVDIYHRVGDKLSENWVFIDIPYWLAQQNLDIFDRTASIVNPGSYTKE